METAVQPVSATPIMSMGTWKSNGELIADVARLGYLGANWHVLDATYGLGRFWTIWRPALLTTNDLDTSRQSHHHYDFRSFPTDWMGFYDAVVFDPPYKLNGTGGSHPSDAAYGVAGSVRWQDKYQLIKDGIRECARVTKLNGYLLIKCQNQVCSGEIRWQMIDFSLEADRRGCRLVDMFHLPTYREQPPGTRQVHSRQNYSTLLVCHKEL